MEKRNLATNDDFIIEFECPICTKYMIPPIMQCMNGHSYCNICFQKIRNCALCRAPKAPSRCVALEKIATCLTFPCIYSDQGCDFKAPGDQISIHQKHCKFSNVSCPLRFNDCQWQGEHSDLVIHCRSQHSQNIFFNSNQNLMSSSFQDPMDRIYYIVFYVFNSIFRCTWDLDANTGLVRCAVYYLGKLMKSNNNNNNSEEQFSFELSYMLPDGKKIITFKAPCYQMEDDEQRFLKGKYFVLHYDQIKDLCDEDGDLNYCVNIFQGI